MFDRRIGAHATGIDRSAPRPDTPVAREADRIVVTPVPDAAVIGELTGGRGADVVLNTVGGATFEPR